MRETIMVLRAFGEVNLSETTKKSNRDYMQSHREEWSELGFRNITCMVHDEEREVVLAELEVRRCDKLVTMSEDKTCPRDTLEKLARRNMPKSPEKGTIAAMTENAKHSTTEKEVLLTISIAENMQKKQTALVTLFGKTDDRDQRSRIAARGVAYSAAAAARFKMAKALLDYYPKKPKAVFGVEGSAAKAEEDNWKGE